MEALSTNNSQDFHNAIFACKSKICAKQLAGIISPEFANQNLGGAALQRITFRHAAAYCEIAPPCSEAPEVRTSGRANSYTPRESDATMSRSASTTIALVRSGVPSGVTM